MIFVELREKRIKLDKTIAFFFFLVLGSRASAVVRPLASHRCAPGSILSSDHMWAKFVVGSFSAPRGFPPGYPGFPLSSKTSTFQIPIRSDAGPPWKPLSSKWSSLGKYHKLLLIIIISYLLKSIVLAPSMSLSAYPSMPSAARTHDLSPSVVASW